MAHSAHRPYWSLFFHGYIGPYSLTVKQLQTDNTIKEVELQLTRITILDPATGWFDLVQVPNYIINDINSKSTQEKFDKECARIIQLFNQTWLSRYPCPHIK